MSEGKVNSGNYLKCCFSYCCSSLYVWEGLRTMVGKCNDICILVLLKSSCYILLNVHY
jgi:hypothetical protein